MSLYYDGSDSDSEFVWDLKEINSSDTLRNMMEKVNYNFIQILLHGGGPEGAKGEQGLTGATGKRGTSIYAIRTVEVVDFKIDTTYSNYLSDMFGLEDNLLYGYYKGTTIIENQIYQVFGFTTDMSTAPDVEDVSLELNGITDAKYIYFALKDYTKNNFPLCEYGNHEIVSSESESENESVIDFFIESDTQLDTFDGVDWISIEEEGLIEKAIFTKADNPSGDVYTAAKKESVYPEIYDLSDYNEGDILIIENNIYKIYTDDSGVNQLSESLGNIKGDTGEQGQEGESATDTAFIIDSDKTSGTYKFVKGAKYLELWNDTDMKDMSADYPFASSINVLKENDGITFYGEISDETNLGAFASIIQDRKNCSLKINVTSSAKTTDALYLEGVTAANEPTSAVAGVDVNGEFIGETTSSSNAGLKLQGSISETANSAVPVIIEGHRKDDDDKSNPAIVVNAVTSQNGYGVNTNGIIDINSGKIDVDNNGYDFNLTNVGTAKITGKNTVTGDCRFEKNAYVGNVLTAHSITGAGTRLDIYNSVPTSVGKAIYMHGTTASEKCTVVTIEGTSNSSDTSSMDTVITLAGNKNGSKAKANVLVDSGTASFNGEVRIPETFVDGTNTGVDSGVGVYQYLSSPIGSMMMYPSFTAPRHWWLCDGSKMSNLTCVKRFVHIRPSTLGSYTGCTSASGAEQAYNNGYVGSYSYINSSNPAYAFSGFTNIELALLNGVSNVSGIDIVISECNNTYSIGSSSKTTYNDKINRYNDSAPYGLTIVDPLKHGYTRWSGGSETKGGVKTWYENACLSTNADFTFGDERTCVLKFSYNGRTYYAMMSCIVYSLYSIESHRSLGRILTNGIYNGFTYNSSGAKTADRGEIGVVYSFDDNDTTSKFRGSQITLSDTSNEVKACTRVNSLFYGRVSILPSTASPAFGSNGIGQSHIWVLSGSTKGSTYSTWYNPQYLYLPNLCQRFPIGNGISAGSSVNIHEGFGSSTVTNNMTGQVGGEKEHTLTVDEMPEHSHDVAWYNANTGTTGYALPGSTTSVGNVYDCTFSGQGHTAKTGETQTDIGFVQNEGGGEAHNNLPPYFAINFIIKYE